MQTLTTDEFEQHRPRLLSLAYRMLGEIHAAEDIVQETWLRWNKADQSAIEAPQAWLSRVATRLAIDQLRSARVKREVYTGPWLPEPIIESESGPAQAMELAQECELALLWSMERLTEEERAAFLLSQVFDTSYNGIADALNKTEDACRQMVSRARKKLKQGAPRFDTSPAQLEQVMLKFAVAASSGNEKEVVQMLAPDVVAFTDGGGIVSAAIIPLEGPLRVARVFTHTASKRSSTDAPKFININGQPALVSVDGGDQDMIFTLRLNSQGQICWIYTLRNPLKLATVMSLR